MIRKVFCYVSLIFAFSSCQKQYSGFCVSGSSPNEYQVLEFTESATSKNAAERKVEKILNSKFNANGTWSCAVK